MYGLNQLNNLIHNYVSQKYKIHWNMEYLRYGGLSRIGAL